MVYRSEVTLVVCLIFYKDVYPAISSEYLQTMTNQLCHCCMCRNHDHHKRPSVHSVTEVLSGPTATLLSIPQEEVQDTRAGQLGAPMECGKQLYIDLQQYYNTN